MALIEAVVPKAGIGRVVAALTLALVVQWEGLNVQAQGWNDVREYWILHGQVFRQDQTNATPRLDSISPFAFEAVLAAQAPGLITAVAVETPGGAQIQPAAQADLVTYASRSMHASEQSLLAAAPLGAYRFAVTSLISGSQTAFLNVSSGGFPAAPVLSGLDPSIPFTQDIPLTWAVFTGATDDDRIEIAIREAEGSLVWTFPDVLNGDSPTNASLSRVIVPADTLSTGTVYEGRIRFIKTAAKDTTSMPGATGRTARYSETRFSLGSAAPTNIPPLILTTSLPPGNVGDEYFEPLVAVGPRPFSWGLEGGSLPRGLQLDPVRGIVGGIPASNGSYQLVVRVQDASGESARQTLSLQVAGVVEQLEIVTTNLPPAEPHGFYFVELEIAGGVEPYAWSLTAGRLPEGLQFNDCCGMIVGFAKEPGQFPMTVQLQDGSGQVTQKNFVIDVSAAAAEPLLRFKSFVRNDQGRIRANITGETGDPITVEMSANLKSWTPLLTALRPESGDLEWDDLDPARRFYRVRFGHPTPEPNPMSVTPVVSTSAVVTLLLTTNAATLSLTNSAGIIYRLDFPTNAVLEPRAIRMALVERIVGLPFEGGLIGGVDLRPSGLELFNHATLTVVFPDSVPSSATTWAYGRGGFNFHLYPAFPGENRLTIPIFHFSGYGQANATPQENQGVARSIPCPNPYVQELAMLIQQHKPNFPPRAAIMNVVNRWFMERAWPLAKAAMTDDTKLMAAWWAYIEAQKCTSLILAENYGVFGGDYGPYFEKMFSTAFDNAFNSARSRCMKEHKLEAARTIIQMVKYMELLGVGHYDLDDALKAAARCLRFELQLESFIEVNAAFEHVRSGKAVMGMSIEYPFAIESFRPMGLSLVAWGIDAPNGQRVRPIKTRRELSPDYLKILYPDTPNEDQPPPGGYDDCHPPRLDDELPPSDLDLYFSVTGDPVTGVEVLDGEGQWMPIPPATLAFQFWEPFFRMAHIQEYGSRPIPTNPNFVGYRVRPGWQMIRGHLYARYTFIGPIAASGGGATETTTLDLYHEPAPLKRTISAP